MSLQSLVAFCVLQVIVALQQIADVSINQHGNLEERMLRKEPVTTDGDVMHMIIDHDSKIHSIQHDDRPIQAALNEDEGKKDVTNPCSSLGCNSYKCEWVSG